MKINDILFNNLRFNENKDKNGDNQNQIAKDNTSKNYWGFDKNVSGILEKYNVPKTSLNREGISDFLKMNIGNMDSKLEVIEIASGKGIDMSSNNLKSIYDALNSSQDLKQTVEVLFDDEQKLTSELDTSKIESIEELNSMKLPDDVRQKLILYMRSGHTLKEALKEFIGKEISSELINKFSAKLGMDSSTAKQILAYAVLISSKEQDFHLQDFLLRVDNVLDKLEKQPLEFKSNEIVTELTNFILDDNFKNLNLVQKESNSLNSIENELFVEAGDNELVEVQEKVQNSLELDRFSKDDMMEVLNELVATMSEINAKMSIDETKILKSYIVESVTVKMQGIKKEFDAERDSMLKILEPIKENVSPEKIKEGLNSVIDKLDKLLMKSDITLYTSMQMEKKLLHFSSDLQLARKYISQNDIPSAKKIINDIYKELSNIKFSPSNKRVQLMLKTDLDQFVNPNANRDKLMNLQNYKQNMISSREVLEIFRKLGLNHEYEVSEKLAQLRDVHKKLELEPNLKSIMYKLENDEKQKNPRVSEVVEKTLSTMVGQQMLNDGDKNRQQSMFFNIPLVYENEIKNMKLYVKSRNSSDRLDWENCNMYFLFSLNKYGETGIKVDIKDRAVAITVKNDSKELKGVIEPLIDELSNLFGDIGLKSSDIKFDSLSNESAVEMLNTVFEAPIVQTGDTKNFERFDFKI